MPSESRIEWTDATWNPVTGCNKVSQGCKSCYAEALFPRAYGKRKFTDVRLHPERLDWPLRWRGSPKAKAEGRPSRIFVNSMSDLFHPFVPFEFIDLVLAYGFLSGHILQILTKRQERMPEYFSSQRHEPNSRATYRLIKTLCEINRKNPRLARGHGIDPLRIAYDLDCGNAAKWWPLPDLWLGVSVEDQATAEERIPILLQTPAAVHWASYEPALGPVDFRPWLTVTAEREYMLDWIVAGGESGPRARPPHPDWFRSVRDQCQAAGVAFFFKQWGSWRHNYSHSPTCRSVSAVPGIAGQNEVDMEFVGKKKAGAVLDGREWKEFPK